MTVERWRCGEIFFFAQDKYDDPFMQVELTVTFTHESGETLIRPAFFMGGDKWCVRFAPTLLGLWSYTTSCTNKADNGLNGLTGSLTCVPYEGECEIYKHGFVKVSDNHRYFTYDDGTPFYYLGDTHWLMHREPFEGSSVEGIDSCFKFIVDYRITQGFTVYQSEPIGLDFKDGMNQEILDKLNNDMDKKFKYIADAGLLHANAQLCFASEIQHKDYTPEYVVKLAKMWSARFGAYPVLWTTAQEVDPDFYNNADITKWLIVSETLYLNDCYKHPLTGHMCNQNSCNPKTTVWGNKYYHSWFGMQPQGMASDHYRDFYNYKPTKPIVNYETGYEHLWSNEKTAYRYGYFAIFCGACGYGYGAHGVWNGNLDTKVWMNYGGYMRWFEGVTQPGAKKFAIMNSFFKAMNWFEIVPHYNDREYWLGPKADAIYATLGDHTHFIFDYSKSKDDYKLLKVENGTYSLLFFDIENGTFTELGEKTVTDGTCEIANYPTEDTALIILTSRRQMFDKLPFNIQTKNRETMLAYKGDTLILKANRPCTYSVDDESIATVDENGVLTAMGKNGTVTVCARSKDEVCYRKFIAVRQDKNSLPDKPEKITPVSTCGWDITAPKEKIVVIPEFTPANYWDQHAKLVALDENGLPSNKVVIGNNFEINPICDCTIYLKMISPSGCESELYKMTFTGFGKESFTLGAEATCSDYYELYPAYGLPQRAIDGSRERFSGWVSVKSCSYDAPATLTITFKQPCKMNNIAIYLTDQQYNLRDFDVIAETDNDRVTLISLRDNPECLVELDFDTITAKKIDIVCYKGDGQGYARVDQVNAYYKER